MKKCVESVDVQYLFDRLHLVLHSSVFCCPLRFFSQIPVINDDLPFKILSGSVILKTNVKEIRGSTVVFEDGSAVENVRELCFQQHCLFFLCPAQFKLISLTHPFLITGG